MRQDPSIDRRTAAAALLGLPLLAAAASVSFAQAQARLPHTLTLGDTSITMLSDGHMLVPAAAQARGIEHKLLDAALAQAGQSGERIEYATNITLVRRGPHTVLIDAGAGPHFMASTGKLLDSLKAAGIDPKSVTHVVYTHAHPDHLWGTLDDFDDSPLFANATHVISAAEWNFWIADDAASKLPEDRQMFAAGAKKTLLRIKDRIKTVNPGEDIAPGVRGIDTAGHTAGHMAIEIAAGSESVIVTGDALLHPVISFAYPDWRPVADHHDADQAAASRRRLLDRLATTRSRLIGYHLPVPGLGRVERRGTTYAFVAGS